MTTIKTPKEKLLDVLKMFQEAVDSRYLKSAPEYSMIKLTTPSANYLETYQLTKNGQAVGQTINIPKDFLVKDATLETCEVDDEPVQGYVVGDQYIDFVINSRNSNDANSASHIYLLVKDLVPVISIGNATGNGNVISDLSYEGGVITPIKGFSALQTSDLTAATSGNGNVFTAVSYANNRYTFTKGITALQNSDLEEITSTEIEDLWS